MYETCHNRRLKKTQIAHERDFVYCNRGDLMPPAYYAGVPKSRNKYVQTSVRAVYTDTVGKLLGKNAKTRLKIKENVEILAQQNFRKRKKELSHPWF